MDFTNHGKRRLTQYSPTVDWIDWFCSSEQYYKFLFIFRHDDAGMLQLFVHPRSLTTANTNSSFKLSNRRTKYMSKRIIGECSTRPNQHLEVLTVISTSGAALVNSERQTPKTIRTFPTRSPTWCEIFPREHLHDESRQILTRMRYDVNSSAQT
jgi:hypothetical protein